MTPGRSTQSQEPLPVHDPLPLSQPQVRGGSRVFAHQAACPFRAFAEHRLVARPLERLQVGLGPMRSGTLMHRALELLWRELRTQQALLCFVCPGYRNIGNAFDLRLELALAQQHRA